MRDINPIIPGNKIGKDSQEYLKQIPDCQRYLAFLQEHLTPDRVNHSLEVVMVMGDLLEVYSLEPCQALTAALLHDAAHDFTNEQLLYCARQAGIWINHPCEAHPIYIHGPVSAVLIQTELGIHDQGILDAVYTHSFMENGSDFHAPLSWCLRFADILAASRTWKDFQRMLKPVAYAGQLHEAAYMSMVWVLDLHRRIGNPIHPRLQEILEELAGDNTHSAVTAQS
jgi:predicted HD superfamily hydrolase involved in NAD metabolism